MSKLYESGKIALPNGETLYVHVSGKGPKILFAQHGGWCDHRCMKPMFPYLEDEFTIIAPDLRGQGESTLVNPITEVDHYVEDIGLVLKHFGIKKCSITAWSLGCVLVVRYAILHPEIVENLFLVGPLSLSGTPCFRKEFLTSDNQKEKTLVASKDELYDNEYIADLIKIVKDKDMKLAKRNLLLDSFEPDHPPTNEELEDLADQLMKSQNVVDVRWLCAQHNYLDETRFGVVGDGSIKKLKAKVFIFHGRKDVSAHPFVLDDYFKQLGSQVKLQWFDCAHAVQYTYPKEVSNAIIQACKPRGKKAEEAYPRL